MSAGRKTAPLADLQGIAGFGHLDAVRKFLLGEDAPECTDDEETPSWEEAFPAANVDREFYGKPADWVHRTTRSDLKRLVADAAKKRLPEADAYLVDHVMFGKRFPALVHPSREDLIRVGRKLRQCAQDEMNGLAPERTRKPKTERMPTRSHLHGECSAVVTRYRNGDVTVEGSTQAVSAAEADKALRTVGVR